MKTHDWLKKNGNWSSHLSKTQRTLQQSPEGIYGMHLFTVFRKKNDEANAEAIRSSINEALQIQFERDMLALHLEIGLIKHRCRP